MALFIDNGSRVRRIRTAYCEPPLARGLQPERYAFSAIEERTAARLSRQHLVYRKERAISLRRSVLENAGIHREMPCFLFGFVPEQWSIRPIIVQRTLAARVKDGIIAKGAGPIGVKHCFVERRKSA